MARGRIFWNSTFPLLGAFCAFVTLLVTPASQAQQLDGDAQVALFLEAYVNGVSRDLVIELSQSGQTLMTDRDELEAIGINVRDLRGREIDLDQIAGLSWRYDILLQRLDLDVTTERLAPNDLSPRRPEFLDPDPGRGIALNYDLNLQTGQRRSDLFKFEGASVGLDGWAFQGPMRLSTSGLISLPWGDRAHGDWRRFESRLTYDLPESATTITFGDSVSSSLGAGRSIRFGGLRISRDFSLRRDLITQPLLAFEGSAAVPSSVDVFIEGNRVFSAETAAGNFRLEDLPVLTGAGVAEVSVRGVDGSLKRLQLPFYGSRNLLRAGTVDWSVEAGVPRFEFGAVNENYGTRPILNATFRRGLRDDFTFELQGSATKDFWHFAAGGQFVLARRADVGLTLGKSVHEGRTGHFYLATLSSRPFGRFRLDASHFRASEGYADLATAVDGQFSTSFRGPDRERDTFSLSLPSRKGGLSFGLSHIRIRRDDNNADLTSFGLSRGLRVGRRDVLLNLNGTQNWRTAETRLSAVMSMQLGKVSVNSAASRQQGMNLVLSRPDDNSIGSWGYSLDVNRLQGDTRTAARVWRNNSFGRAELTARQFKKRSTVDVRLQGAFAVMDNRLTAGRRISGSFAVVDLGREGVPVRLQNRIVAETGRSGRVLISGLQAYARNRISIETDDLSEGAVWSVTASDIVPSRASGAYVDLRLGDETILQTIQLLDASGVPLPVGTSVLVGTREHDMGVGYDGLLLLNDVDAGTALVTAACRATVPNASTDGAPAVAICR